MDQFLHIGHVQADRRFIQHVERMRELARAAGAGEGVAVGVDADLRKFGHQLDALGLTAGERRALLAECEVAEAHVLHQAQRMVDRGVRREELHALVDVHRKDVADGFVAPLDRQRLGVEALAIADVAKHAHIRQERHLDALHPLAFAGLAAAALGVEREPAGRPAAHARLVRLCKNAADRIPEAHVGRRARARRLADRGLVHFEHAAHTLGPLEGLAAFERDVGFRPPLSHQLGEVRVQHIAGERGLARAGHAGDDGEASQRHARADVPEVVQRGAADFDRRCGLGDHAARMDRVAQRGLEEPSGERLGVGHQVFGRPFGDHAAAEAPGAGAEVQDMVRATDRVLVVLHHHQRVALGLELLEHVEQDLVVARMQADGRLVEDVAHAAQVGTQLRREADALRLATRECRRRAVERQVAEADLFEEAEARAQFGEQVARDLLVAARELHVLHDCADLAYRQRGEIRDRAVVVTHGEGLGVQALAVAGGAGFLDFQPFEPGVEHVVLGAGLLALGVPVDAGELHAGAVAGGAPAVLGVEREEARVELREAARARRAGALGGEDLLVQLHLDERGLGLGRSLHQRIEVRQHVHHALAELERLGELAPEHRLVFRGHPQVGHRQFQRVFLEAVEARPGGGRHELAVDAQVRVALAARPLGEVGVEALAIHHQRREQADALALVVAHQARHDRVLGLRLDRHVAVGAVLRAELHVHQPQEVVDLGERGHRGLAPAAAGALLDRHGGRDAEDCVHVRPGRGLHELAGVGVQRFEVAALALGEDDVERERRLARARHARDHGEAPARDLDVDVLEVVFARVVDADVVRQQFCLQRLLAQDAGGRGVGQRLFVSLEGHARVRGGVGRDVERRADRDDHAAGFAAFGPEVDDPVGSRDDV